LYSDREEGRRDLPCEDPPSHHGSHEKRRALAIATPALARAPWGVRAGAVRTTSCSARWTRRERQNSSIASMGRPSASAANMKLRAQIEAHFRLRSRHASVCRPRFDPIKVTVNQHGPHQFERAPAGALTAASL
jgi:hypothetical protein